VSEQHSRRTASFHPLELCSAHSWSYRATSSTPPNRHRRPSSMICRLPWRAAHHRRRGNLALAPRSLPEELLLARFPQRRCTAAIGPNLRRSLPRIGVVNTFLSPADRRESGQDLNGPTQADQNTGGHRACTAATQGMPRCAGATCPHAAAATAAMRATAAVDFHTSADYATSNNSHIIIRPAASQHPAAGATQPLSLPPQSLGGPVFYVVAYQLLLAAHIFHKQISAWFCLFRTMYIL
jgi:hypothetical protein